MLKILEKSCRIRNRIQIRNKLNSRSRIRIRTPKNHSGSTKLERWFRNFRQQHSVWWLAIPLEKITSKPYRTRLDQETCNPDSKIKQKNMRSGHHTPGHKKNVIQWCTYRTGSPTHKSTLLNADFQNVKCARNMADFQKNLKKFHSFDVLGVVPVGYGMI